MKRNLSLPSPGSLTCPSFESRCFNGSGRRFSPSPTAGDEGEWEQTRSGARSRKRAGREAQRKTNRKEKARPATKPSGERRRFARLMTKGDRKEYLRKRDEQPCCGQSGRPPTKDQPRIKAIQELERQESSLRAAASKGLVQPLISNTSWTPIGPAPLPNGQTDTVVTPVSGRVTCVAIHPTNIDIVYVGTAQSGVYRTLNGGQTWTAFSTRRRRRHRRDHH